MLRAEPFIRHGKRSQSMYGMHNDESPTGTLLICCSTVNSFNQPNVHRQVTRVLQFVVNSFTLCIVLLCPSSFPASLVPVLPQTMCVIANALSEWLARFAAQATGCLC
jgi:hypothetical protein